MAFKARRTLCSYELASSDDFDRYEKEFAHEMRQKGLEIWHQGLGLPHHHARHGPRIPPRPMSRNRIHKDDGVAAKKHLGQHFLKDPAVSIRIAGLCPNKSHRKCWRWVRAPVH